MAEISEIIVTTSNEIPGFNTIEHLGLAVGIGNVNWNPFSGFTSTKARRAYAKAFTELGEKLNALNADAAISLTVQATSGGSFFSRPHTVILTASAVKLSKR